MPAVLLRTFTSFATTETTSSARLKVKSDYKREILEKDIFDSSIIAIDLPHLTLRVTFSTSVLSLGASITGCYNEKKDENTMEALAMHIVLVHSKYENVEEARTTVDPMGANRMATTVKAVKDALEVSGHEVIPVEADYQLLSKIKKMKTPDLIFNLSTGISDKRSQANVVGMLEMLHIPVLGSGLTTHVLGLHKEITKSLLYAHNVRTARYQLVEDKNAPIRKDFIYPVIVKPEHEGSGIGITASSKVDTPEKLRKIIMEKIALHKQELLIEEYLPGREFTVGVMGNAHLEILPIKETIFLDEDLKMLTYDLKMENDVMNKIPADIPEKLEDEIKSMVEKTYRILRCQDFARIDIRLDAEGKPTVMELNTYPGLVPDFSFFPMLAEAAGYSYAELINRLVEIALEPVVIQ